MIATTIAERIASLGPVPIVIVVLGLLITAWLVTRRHPPTLGHAGTVITVGNHDHAIVCECKAVFPVRRGEDPDQCPEWHAHVTIAHLRVMSEAKR